MSVFFSIFRSKKQVFLYEFTIKRLDIIFSKAVRIVFTIKRSNFYLGNKRIESQKYAYSPSIGNIEVNETLTMAHTLYSEKNGKFKAKSIEIIITAFLDNNINKKIGQLDINLADYIDLQGKENLFSLKDCSDKSAKLLLAILTKPINDKDISDNASDISGIPSSGIEKDLTASVFSSEYDRSRSKPPTQYESKIYSENKELREKVEELEKQLVNINNEKNNLKIQLGIAFEKSKQEREDMIAHMKDLDTELQEQRSYYESILKGNENQKAESTELKNANLAISEKLKNSEEIIENLRKDNEKYKIGKKTLKKHIQEIMQNEQKNMEEIIQLRFQNNDLNNKLKK